ncbi:hypothetical protein L7F22_033104, partial [Adiantum nelumboides]|nr:hypothetical protein [Adiantum nelumboides]
MGGGGRGQGGLPLHDHEVRGASSCMKWGQGPALAGSGYQQQGEPRERVESKGEPRAAHGGALSCRQRARRERARARGPRPWACSPVGSQQEPGGRMMSRGSLRACRQGLPAHGKELGERTRGAMAGSSGNRVREEEVRESK